MLQALKSQRGRGWTFLLVGPPPRVWLEGEMSTLKCRRDRGEGISMGLWFSRGVKLQPWGAAAVVGRGKWERGGRSERERVKERGGLEPFEMRHLYVWGLQEQVCFPGVSGFGEFKVMAVGSDAHNLLWKSACVYSGMGRVMVIHSHRREHVLKGAGWKDG